MTSTEWSRDYCNQRSRQMYSHPYASLDSTSTVSTKPPVNPPAPPLATVKSPEPKRGMSRNTALNLLAWLITLFVANGTSVGTILTNEASWAVVMYRTGRTDLNPMQYVFLAQNPDVQTTAWWIVFGVLTLLAIFLGRIFIALWGTRN